MSNHRSVGSELKGSPLVGVTSTLYTDRNDPRFGLALENAEAWQAAGLPYVVVDASPESWAGAAHRKRGAFVVPSQINGIATQRQQGVKFAIDSGAEKVVGHEPEKIMMTRFSTEIAAGLEQHAVLVIGRTAFAGASLPTTQRRTEQMAGWI